MALTDQPYFPFYVDDYLTDEKLLMCDSSSEGVYARLLCHFHKSDCYGKILITDFEKAKFKQKVSKLKAKSYLNLSDVDHNLFLMYVEKVNTLIGKDKNIIESALFQLLSNKVIIIEGGILKNNTNHFNRKSLYLVNRPLWISRIKLVFKRDNYTCQYCGNKSGILEADHIIPKSKGGSDEVHNLNTSCRPCNRKKGNKTLESFLKTI